MDFGIITYLSGIASLLGLILQFIDAFPEYRQIRKIIFLIILGVFVGTILGSLNRVSIKIDYPISGLHLLVGIMICTIVLLAFVGAFTGDTERRNSIYATAAIGLVAMLFILAVGTLSMTHDPFTKDEAMLLADKNIEMGNIDHAILILEYIKVRLDRGDPRFSAIDKKINELKSKSLK